MEKTDNEIKKPLTHKLGDEIGWQSDDGSFEAVTVIEIYPHDKLANHFFYKLSNYEFVVDL